MKIILLAEVRNLGKRGELKEVSGGYAQNFLFPRKLAEIATPEAIEKIRLDHKVAQEKEMELEENFRKIASEIQKQKIILKAKAEKGKLFGRVGPKEISNELKRQNFDISEKSIILKEPIKSIGEKEITIDFGKNIKTKLIIFIEKA
jgi:large subunit ribosomal protein L9